MRSQTGRSRGDVTVLPDDIFADDILIDSVMDAVIDAGRKGPVLEAEEGVVVV